MAELAIPVVLGVTCCTTCNIICGITVLDDLNERIHHYLTDHKIDATDRMNGLVQKMPDRRMKKGQKSDEEWREIPYIQAICEYARNRKGILNFYWTNRLFILHQMYTNWLRTVPDDSPVFNGKEAETFVELHLNHFRNGLSGRLNNKF